MNEAELIVSALTAGLSAGATTTASNAVQDVYSGLRDAVRRRLSRESGGRGDAVIDEHAQDPVGKREPLITALRAAGIDQDPELVSAALKLMALVGQAHAHPGKYSVSMPDAKGVQIGDRNKQINRF